MKTKLISILVVLSLVLTGCSASYSKKASTVEKAIDYSNPERINVIHKEITKNGVIVFYNKFSSDELSVCFVKKVLGGWKYIYGGIQTEVSVVANRIGDGIYGDYFPSINKTPFPMFYGIITKPEITKVEIVQKKNQKRINAKIITGGEMTIWLNYDTEFEGNEFEVVGLTKKGIELTNIEIDTNRYKD